MCIFNLELPIGWNELGVIATIGAVIVALWANHKANTQLTSALRIQEQSKNVELLDKRMEIIDRISTNRAIADEYLRVLFDDDIAKKYREMMGFQKKAEKANSDIEEYLCICKERQEQFVLEVEETINRYENQLAIPNCPKSLEQEFKAFCDSQQITAPDMESGVGVKVYNYYDLSMAKKENEDSYNEIKKRLVSSMEDYVKTGIKPLTANKK